MNIRCINCGEWTVDTNHVDLSVKEKTVYTCTPLSAGIKLLAEYFKPETDNAMAWRKPCGCWWINMAHGVLVGCSEHGPALKEIK